MARKLRGYVRWIHTGDKTNVRPPSGSSNLYPVFPHNRWIEIYDKNDYKWFKAKSTLNRDPQKWEVKSRLTDKEKKLLWSRHESEAPPRLETDMDPIAVKRLKNLTASKKKELEQQLQVLDEKYQKEKKKAIDKKIEELEKNTGGVS